MGKASCKVALATQGTRGDFQPMLSLALAFRRAGHTVFLMGNEDHIKIAKDFGLEGYVCCSDVKDVLTGEHGKEAMETGDLVASWKGLKNDASDWEETFKAGLDGFNPDVMVYSTLMQNQVVPYMQKCRPDLVALTASYQPMNIPSDDFAPNILYRVELEEGCPILTKWVICVQSFAQIAYQAIQDAKERGAPQSEIDAIEGPEACFMRGFQFEDSYQPYIMAFSEAWWPAPVDWPKTGVEIVGRWCMPKEEQEERVKEGHSFFSVGSEQQQCTDFISAGGAPVYIGWGSMAVHSPERMTILAVDALRIAGYRGIIVAGWGDFSAERLATAPNAEELRAYCEKNVLFLKAAPHEWLFPQCVCCVHHGGIGTAQASLAAGSPTIVTPVFADQHDVAGHITKNGWGLGTCRLPQLGAEELGAAIKAVAGDKTMKASVVALAEKMAQEDGVGRTVALVEKFMADEVMTGKWAEKKKAFLDKASAWRQKNASLTFEQINGQFTIELSKRYPSLKAWNEKSISQFSKLLIVAGAKKLYYVKGSSCLARAGEKLKSDEVGRFKEFAFLELLEQKGSRLHVKRMKGVGPEEGWVSAEVKGVEIVAQCGTDDIMRLQVEELTKMFEGVF